MAKTEKLYIPLPGTGIRRENRFASSYRRSRLYLGQDHLLLVESAWYVEEYRRFYYRDIQAFVIRKTWEGKAWSIAWGVLGGFLALLVIAVTDPAGRIALGIGSGFFLLLLGINWLMGPTCSCQLQTAVQAEQLPSLLRVKKARKALARIRARIDEAQPAPVAPMPEPILAAVAPEPAASLPAAPLEPPLPTEPGSAPPA